MKRIKNNIIVNSGKRFCLHKWVPCTVRDVLGEEHAKVEYNGKTVEVKRENFGEDIASQIAFTLANNYLSLKLLGCKKCGRLCCSEFVAGVYNNFLLRGGADNGERC